MAELAYSGNSTLAVQRMTVLPLVPHPYPSSGNTVLPAQNMYTLPMVPHPYTTKIVTMGLENQYLLNAGTVAGSGNPGDALLIPTIGQVSTYVAVATGDNILSADLKQASNGSPRPKLTIKANPSLGVPVDIPLTASSSTDYVTLTQSITAVSGGVVEMVFNNYRANDPLLVDNVGIQGQTSSMGGNGSGVGGTLFLGPPGRVTVVSSSGGETRIPSIG